MTKKRTKREQIGFKQSFEYLLDLLCYAYYVKHDNLVSDATFDELEGLYKKMFKEHTAPMRMIELEWLYSNGVQVVYTWFKRKKRIKNRKD